MKKKILIVLGSLVGVFLLITIIVLATSHVPTDIELQEQKAQLEVAQANLKALQETRIKLENEAKAAKAIQESPEMQEKRLAWIQKAIDMGIFYKVDYEDSVWVKPLFYSLSFDDKQTFIAVVYTYYKVTNPKLIAVFVKDYGTNKTIGTFAEWSGLKLD